jgi:hypothetical protein
MMPRRPQPTPVEIYVALFGHTRSGPNFFPQFRRRDPSLRQDALLSVAFRESEALLREGHDGLAARLHAAAVAGALCATGQLGIAELVRLDVERHLVRDSRGGVRRIAIPAADTGIGLTIDLAVPAPLAKQLKTHIHFRQYTAGTCTTALFPGNDGGASTPEQMQSLLKLLVTAKPSS